MKYSKRRPNQETGNVLSIGTKFGRRVHDVSFFRFDSAGPQPRRRRGQPPVWNKLALGLLLQEYGKLVLPRGPLQGLPAELARAILADEYGIKADEVKRRITEARAKWRRHADRFPDWLRPILRARRGKQGE